MIMTLISKTCEGWSLAAPIFPAVVAKFVVKDSVHEYVQHWYLNEPAKISANYGRNIRLHFFSNKLLPCQVRQ